MSLDPGALRSLAAEPWPKLVFGAQVLSTGAMFGLIWFVQGVHYPLFLRIAPAEFAAWESEHANRTGFIAAPLMLVELGTALLLCWPVFRHHGIQGGSAAWGAALALATWVTTFAVQVPLHNHLHRGFDRRAVQQLIRTNWVRTALWTLRAALVAWWVVQVS